MRGTAVPAKCAHLVACGHVFAQLYLQRLSHDAQVYADWGAAKTHLAEDFVDGWWKYTRTANIPVKALPLVFVTE